MAEVNRRVPLQLRWIIERCLTKTPAERYGVTADLHRAPGTLRDRLPEAIAREREPREKRRSRSMAARVTVVVLALALAAPTNKISFAATRTLVLTNVLDIVDPDQFIRDYRGGANWTNFLNLLVSSGELCRVRSHLWQPGCGLAGCLTYHPFEMRHCALCKTTQSRQPGDWK